MNDEGIPPEVSDESSAKYKSAQLHHEAWTARRRADKLEKESRRLIREAGYLRVQADALDDAAKRVFVFSDEGGDGDPD